MRYEMPEYSLIEDEQQFEEFLKINEGITWMGIDTEFVGEKRFTTLLCLIQVSSEKGYFLIDTIKIDRIDGLLKMIQDPAILKISHAGDNDYRLFYQLYKITPKNIFDTQIAAGFVGTHYPMSFQRLVNLELDISVSKGYTVSDWESRPIKKKQLNYALNDVLFLRQLYDNLSAQLEKLQRTEWVNEEFLKLEDANYYIVNPNKDALNSNIISHISPQEQAFLLRLHNWRKSEAKRKNYSKEMILSSKLFGVIVKNINSGKGALMNNRRIPKFVINQHLDTFSKLFNQKITEEEREILKQIPRRPVENPELDNLMELLYLLLTYQCNANKIAPSLVLHRSTLKKMKYEPGYFYEMLDSGWRKDLLGSILVNWFKNRKKINVNLEEGQVVITMKGI